MRYPRSTLSLLSFAFVLASLGPSVFGQEAIDFSRDIRPIFEQACFSCHGPARQRGGFRLDRRTEALRGGDSGAAILPGEGSKSPLVERIAASDLSIRMPPKGEPLSADQVSLVRAWIDTGAIWPDEVSGDVDPLDWWSLRPITSPAPPTATGSSFIRTPIDAFILASLQSNQMTPSPEAEKRVLLRRVYFDLIGLPPTIEEIEAFEQDASPDAYERVVDRLLTSPRHGERWARHWMDVAHFAETHGHDQDRIREGAWPYRDYLIDAFNQDLAYAQFVEEQIAGDVLAPERPQAVVALGFLAAGPWDESSLRDIREETLDRQVGRYLDRDDIVTNVMQTFASATVQCARCHDHKFDPISQRDYYALQAVFSGVDKTHRRYDPDPSIRAKREQLLAAKARIAEGEPKWIESERADLAVAELRKRAGDELSWRVVSPELFVSTDGATLKLLDDQSILASGKSPATDTYVVSARLPIQNVSAIRIELLPDDSLPKRGPGRQENGNLHLSEARFSLASAKASTPLKVAKAVADFNQDGWTIEHTIDGAEKTAWGIYPQVGQSHEATWILSEPQKFDDDSRLEIVLQQRHGGSHTIGRFRLFVSDARPESVFILPSEIRSVLTRDEKEWTIAERDQVRRFALEKEIDLELAALPPPAKVYAVASDYEPDGALKPFGRPRTVHVLQRGDIRKPLEEASPGALSCLGGLDARFDIRDSLVEHERRSDLAYWLTHPDNSLAWRSIVNRIWRYHFGRGIVDTPNDFGRMGEAPSHPELLDWLAGWFRDHSNEPGLGSLKALHRMMVTSATYRQSSHPREDFAARDGANRGFWRMNRIRLEAECVRDAILFSSDQLDLRMGGPSDRQFDLQPGIHVTPRVDYSKFDLSGAGGRRRSVYRFLFRTLPDPMMDALDCPSGDQLTPTRTASVTVQQALAMWNSEFVARQSEQLAARIRSHSVDASTQVARLFELTLGRKPTETEAKRFSSYVESFGLENACRVLFNSSEFMFAN